MLSVLFSKLRFKLLMSGFMLGIFPLVLIVSISFYQDLKIKNVITSEISTMANLDLEHIVKGVYATCEAIQEQVQNEVNNALNVAQYVMARQGSVEMAHQTVSWHAVNQYTREKESISLPQFLVGGKWIGKTDEMSVTSGIVDKVKSLVGGTCTLFQRMDGAGSMLRVATNVIKKDGKRAVGTYIPAVNPDGKPNPVIATVLGGKTFKGRAFVVDRWYITAYAPIFDTAGQVIGVLYVGLPQESVTTLRRAIMDTRVGQSGYMCVMDTKGNYIISKSGKRDGENLLSIKVPDGSYPAREIVNKARELDGGAVGSHRYYWSNTGENQAREKVAKFMYFKPWDWIIASTAYVDEFESTNRYINTVSYNKNMMQCGIILSILFIVTLFWWTTANRITRPLTSGVDFAQTIAKGDFTNAVSVETKDETGSLVKALNTMSKSLQKTLSGIVDTTGTLTHSASGLSEVSGQIAVNSEQTRDESCQMETAAVEMSGTMKDVSGAAAQANVNIQMIASAAEQMSTSISEISVNTSKGSETTAEAVRHAESVSGKMTALDQAASDIGKVTDTISDISDRTNLLALNATIEAARAGETGKGFTVVASEIKNLASQTAEATDEISEKIVHVQSTTAESIRAIEAITSIVNQVNEIVGSVAAAIEEQSATTREISANVNQAAKSVENVNSNVTNATGMVLEITRRIGEVSQAAEKSQNGSREVHSSAEKLSKLATELNDMVSEFKI